MSIWFVIPSARPIDEAKECFDSWKAIGCWVAATRKDPADERRLKLDFCLSLPKYRGYYAHINILAKAVLDMDRDCTIVATGGDDVFPDPAWPAEVVERQFIDHFGGTLGVMQPTGLAWDNEVIDGRQTQERIAWAPWLGREWCERAYQGRGPYWSEFTHFFGDEFLQLTADRMGLFWQRRDIMQEHRQPQGTSMPEFRKRANRWWDNDKTIFRHVRHPDWPGAQLLPR